MKKLNLGCGLQILDGYTNLDCVALQGVDVIHNLNKTPYPFKSNVFDEILCSHVLEHMDDVIKTLKELHRITKKNGLLKIHVPYFSNPGMFSDPTHKHFFTYTTFDYFTASSGLNYYSDLRFNIHSRRLILFTSSNLFFQLIGFIPQFLINLFPNVYQRFFSYILPVAEIQVELHVIK